MKVWIDKKGGRHYHKSDCPMVKEPHYHYEPISQKILHGEEGYVDISHKGKRYCPCPGCFGK